MNLYNSPDEPYMTADKKSFIKEGERPPAEAEHRALAQLVVLLIADNYDTASRC